jgi:sensor histidine kinase YesM
MNRMRLQAGRQELTTRQYLLLAQMNPHFIFNALTNIQSLIMQRDPVTSGKFLDLFARLTLRIREHSEMELVRLEEEFSLIRDYIELQKLRYGDKFDWEFSVPDSVKQYNFVIPPMLLQPAVENAIEHGLKYREGKGLITFRISVSGEKELTAEIEDDGIGREKAMEIARQNPGHHQGLATKITRERIEQFNKRKRRKFLFEITDKKTDSGEPSGTIVKFIFPQMILK